MSYSQEYQSAEANPESFWLTKAQSVAWAIPPKISHDEHFGWFPDGYLNTSYLALDHHIEQGRGDQIALIYDSPVSNTKAKFTYLALREQVAKFADVLVSNGVQQGDTVVIYMPMIPEAAIAMLACARIGAIHSVVFGGFAANELAVRIDDAKPKVLVTASCGIEVDKIIEYKPLVDKALSLANESVSKCVVLQREYAKTSTVNGRDLDWHEEMATAKSQEPLPLPANAPLYVLYTSGTTGKPKGVVRDNGGHAVAMSYSMKTVYDAKVGDVFWSASDVGWVVGHSYIVYGPLIAGCSTVLYEGKPIKTPDAGAFWRVCEEYNVNVLFAAPTAFRAIRKEDPEASYLDKYDVSSLKRIYLAGERLDPSTLQWLEQKTNKPIIDHWWQTETGWAIAGAPVGLGPFKTKAGSAGLPMPGFKVRIIDDNGTELAREQQGNVAIKCPLPPGCLPTLWQDHERFQSSYLSQFPGYYVSGDGGYFDRDGYLHIMGRTDDVINVAGHRLSTGEMEQSIASHQAVAECAVVGMNCPLKGQVPLAFVVCKNGTQPTTELESELKSGVRESIGAIASLKSVLMVEKLPKTRSGKILRKLIRQMVSSEEITVPSTIEDPSVVDSLKLVLKHQLVNR